MYIVAKLINTGCTIKNATQTAITYYGTGLKTGVPLV